MSTTESSTSIPAVVVTGGSGGIGAAVCKLFSDSGYLVIAQYHPMDTERAHRLRDSLLSNGGRCEIVEADFLEPESVDNVVSAVDSLDRSRGDFNLTTLVNCAGLLLGPSFEAATMDEFDTYFAVNTRAPFFLSQALVKRMDGGGSIVNVSSAAAHFSSPDDIIYAMSKAAIESLTKNMAEAVAQMQVRVNAVIPGFTNNGHPAFQQSGLVENMGRYSVLGGVSDPETVAQAIYFLASDSARRSTGAILDVSGGSTLGSHSAGATISRDSLAYE